MWIILWNQVGDYSKQKPIYFKLLPLYELFLLDLDVMSNATLRNITFDDRDTERLNYSGEWFIEDWNSTSGRTGSLTYTNDTEATVAFSFPVPANAFFYYGLRRSRRLGGLYAICIDCDSSTPNFEEIDAVDDSTDDIHSEPVLLYFRTFTSTGQHEILLKNQRDIRSPNGNSQLTIDRFELQAVSDTSPASPSTPPATATLTTPSMATSSILEPGNDKPGRVGAITGGVIGGCAGLLALIGMFIYFWRRKSGRASGDSQLRHGSDSESADVLPYTFTLSAKNRRGPKENRSVFERPVRGVHTTRRWEQRRAIDAGRVDSEEHAEPLPPEYNQLFRSSRFRVSYPKRLSR